MPAIAPSGFEKAPDALAVGASPWSYTVGATPETLLLRSGTVSNITLNGVSIATAAATLALPLEAGDVVVITRTGTPTALRRLRS
jgi:hypothetical protein